MPRQQPIVYRHEISQIPPENLQQHLESLSAKDKRIVSDYTAGLVEKYKGIGDVTALEIAWAIGRLLNRTIS